MAEAPAIRRRRVRGEEGEQHRAVRARVDDAETRLDSIEAATQRHETRLQFTEVPLRVVLRGFKCVAEFFRLLRSHDLRAAKTAFIPSFFDELKEQSGPEVTRLSEEAENLMADRQGWVLLGVFPAGGQVTQVDDQPDGLIRLQPGYAGSRMRHVLVQAARCLSDTRQLFQDRVRRPQGGKKGGAKGKGKGKGKEAGGRPKGGKGKDQRCSAESGLQPPRLKSELFATDSSSIMAFPLPSCFCRYHLGSRLSLLMVSSFGGIL